MIGTLDELPRPLVGGRAMTEVARTDRAAAPASTAARWSTAAIFATDCATQLDPSILYVLPLVLIRCDVAKRSLPVVALLLVVAMLVGYAAKIAIAWSGDATLLAAHELLNRGFAALTVLMSSLVLVFTAGAPLGDGFRDDFDRLLASLAPILTLALSVAIAIGTVVTDLLAPGEYNPAIAFVLPVALIAVAGSGRMVWIAVLLCALLTVAGYVYGRAPGVDAALLPWLLANRALALAAVIGVAVLLPRDGPQSHPATNRTHA